MKRTRRTKKCGFDFDFDFGLLQIGDLKLDQVDGMKRILTKRLLLC